MASDLFYNRDENISGVAVVTGLSNLGTPSYGSSVSFKSRMFEFTTQDNFSRKLPESLNSLEANFSLKYETNEVNTQKAAVFLEEKNGVDMFQLNINDTIYKPVSGICDSYSINHINNNHYELTMETVVDQAPNLLNWSGMTFSNYTLQYWQNSTSYSKYDIVYREKNSNKLNNFFYCTEDHTSTALNDPTGTGENWTQDFFFEPDIGMSNTVNFKNKKNEFKNSFNQRIKSDVNNASFPVSYKYSNISDKQIKAMNHFLENKGGYRKFRHQIPSVYNRPKVFYCPSWTHTWKYFNSHDIQVDLIEDVLGIIPTDT